MTTTNQIKGFLITPPYDGWGHAAPQGCEYSDMFRVNGLIFDEPVKNGLVEIATKGEPYVTYKVTKGKLISEAVNGSKKYEAIAESI